MAADAVTVVACDGVLAELRLTGRFTALVLYRRDYTPDYSR